MLSEDDGHATGGSLAFGVGEDRRLGRASRSGGAEPALSWREGVLRWLDFAFLAALVGSLVVAAVVLPERALGQGLAPSVVRVAARMLRLGALCALLAAASGIARLVYEVVAACRRGGPRDQASMPRSTSSEHEMGMDVARPRGRAASPSRRSYSPTLRPAGPAGGALGGAAGASASSVVAAAHALSEPRAPHSSRQAPWPSRPTRLHVLSAGAWLGSVAAFAVAVWPAGSLDRVPTRARLARACRTPFAECMALSVGVVLATGLYSAGREVASVDGLLTTTYGHVLLVKIGIVLLAGLLGAANFLLLRALGDAEGRFGGSAAPGPSCSRRLQPGLASSLLLPCSLSSVPGARLRVRRSTSGAGRNQNGHDAAICSSRVSSTPTRVGQQRLQRSRGQLPPAAACPASMRVTTRAQQREASARTRRARAQIEPGRYRRLGGSPGAGTLASSSSAQAAAGGRSRRAVRLVGSCALIRRARSRTPHASLPLLLDAAAALLFGATLLAAAWLLAGKPRIGLGQASTPLTGGSRGRCVVTRVAIFAALAASLAVSLSAGASARSDAAGATVDSSLPRHSRQPAPTRWSTLWSCSRLRRT